MVDFSKIKSSKSMEIHSVANKLIREGKDIFSLGIGDTHFPPPFSVLQNLANLPSAYSHYSPSRGIEELRSEIALKYKSEAENITITNGVKQGIYYALLALKEDTVCILEPAWLGYGLTSRICEKKLISVNFKKSNWLDQLNNRLFNVLILCSPNNPDGKVFSKDEILSIIKICRINNAYIIFDDIYHEYDYSGLFKETFSLILNYEKLILTGGFSKSHAVTGFRIGYIITKIKSLNNRINLLNQNIATCAPSISQYSLLGLEKHNKEVKQYSEYYKQNRDLVTEIIPSLMKYKPDGGFYYFIDTKDFGYKDGSIFCKKILDEQGVVLIPGSAYGEFDSYIRLSFCVSKKTLRKALNRFKKFINV